MPDARQLSEGGCTDVDDVPAATCYPNHDDDDCFWLVCVFYMTINNYGHVEIIS